MINDTSCQDCVFAEWEGNKQSGCRFGRLDKFEDCGTPLILEEGDGKLYARIVGRICNACRDASTLKHIAARKWMENVRTEIIPRIAMAVYVDDSTSANYDFYKSLNSIRNQTIAPYEIILIYNVNGEIASSYYTSWFYENCPDIPWRIQSIKGVSVPLKEELVMADYYQSVDLTVQSNEMKAIYFSVCKAGYEYPNDYIKIIDHAINDEMIRFVALLPDEEGNGLFVQRGLHKLIQGSKQINVIDKIREIAKEEGTSHMVKRFDELPKMVQ